MDSIELKMDEGGKSKTVKKQPAESPVQLQQTTRVSANRFGQPKGDPFIPAAGRKHKFAVRTDSHRPAIEVTALRTAPQLNPFDLGFSAGNAAKQRGRGWPQPGQREKREDYALELHRHIH